MLVHYKSPKGVLCFQGIKVYGAHTNMDPVDLPYSIYETSKDLFVEATYREQTLSKIFNRKISPIAFKYSELEYLPMPPLIRLAKELGILYRSKGTICNAIQEGIRNPKDLRSSAIVDRRMKTWH